MIILQFGGMLGGRPQIMFDGSDDDDSDGDEDDIVDLMTSQVAERLEGAPGCAEFPRAFRDLHSQVQIWLLATFLSWVCVCVLVCSDPKISPAHDLHLTCPL